MTETLSLAFAANADWRHDFVVRDDAGDPVAIGGGRALMHLTRADEPGAPVLVLSTEGSDALLRIPEGATGVISLRVPFRRVTALAGAYVFDLLITAGDARTRPFAGTVTVDPGVTRWPAPAA